MISVAYSSIPLFLQDGSFYKSLSDEEKGGEIQIPEGCFTAEEDVRNTEDFTKLIKITSFWCLNKIPDGVTKFCDETESSGWSKILEDEYTEMNFSRDLLAIFNSDLDESDRLMKAIELGRTEIVAYLAPKISRAYGAPEMAALHGRLDCLQILFQCNLSWDEDACVKAVEGGHLDCLQYLHTNGCPWDDRVHLVAAQKGHQKCMEYAFEQGLKWSKHNVLSSAAFRGDLDMIKYLIERKCPLVALAADNAALNGHLECLRFLLDQGCPMGDDICASAVHHNHADCLALVHQRGAVVQPWVYHLAAEAGHLACVQYLHENNCPWDYKVPELAASHGHINVLRYALENDCDFEEALVNFAVEAVSDTDLTCLRFLIEERELPVFDDGMEFITAFACGNYRAMQFLVQIGAVYLPQECSEEVVDAWSAQLEKYLRQKYNVTVKSTHDANLQQCILYAAANGWDFAVEGASAVLLEFVRANEAALSLCAELLSPVQAASLKRPLEVEEFAD